MNEMEIFRLDGIQYEVVDGSARTDISNLKTTSHLHLNTTAVPASASYNTSNPPAITLSPSTATHIEIGSNTILSKSNRVTMTPIEINNVSGGKLLSNNIILGNTLKIKDTTISQPDSTTTSVNINLPSSTGRLALTSQLPTSVSQLTNDSHYATTSQIPTSVSQLTNDSHYATTSGTVQNSYNSDKVYVVDDNSASEVTYSLASIATTSSSSASTAFRSVKRLPNINITQAAGAGTTGVARLELGNNISAPYGGNTEGAIRLYDNVGKYTDIYCEPHHNINQTQNNTSAYIHCKSSLEIGDYNLIPSIFHIDKEIAITESIASTATQVTTINVGDIGQYGNVVPVVVQYTVEHTSGEGSNRLHIQSVGDINHASVITGSVTIPIAYTYDASTGTDRFVVHCYIMNVR